MFTRGYTYSWNQLDLAPLKTPACSASLARKDAVAVPVASEANSKFRNHCPGTEGVRLGGYNMGIWLYDMGFDYSMEYIYHHMIDEITVWQLDKIGIDYVFILYYIYTYE